LRRHSVGTFATLLPKFGWPTFRRRHSPDRAIFSQNPAGRKRFDFFRTQHEDVVELGRTASQRLPG